MRLTPLSDNERLDWLRLIRTESVGPLTFYRLVERFGSASRALEALPELAKKGGRAKPLIPCPAARAEKELETLTRYGARLVTVADGDYPLALSALEDAPPVLTVLGNPALLNTRCIGMVGARNASYNGKKFASKLAGELGVAGFTVVSGLARGIDTAAHQGSLSTATIAVIAGGIDVVYPQENKALYNDIREKGLIVAENPFGFAPRPQDFPRRNRIVSGVSEGVVVVEASLRSGSLITARLAAEQGRDVFAVPGFPLDPRADGPNKLIRDGATLVRNAADIVDSLDGFSAKSLREGGFSPFMYEPEEELAVIDGNGDEEAGALVLQNLSHSPVAVDELIHACHVSIPAVQKILLELELAGRLTRHPGGKVSLAE
ncbi:MAG: DNA-protecting protein DprA [Alphaproteobacteria bacterium]|nr:DNA-protecting protein DprA [Alphaproteobacteria bacterium]